MDRQTDRQTEGIWLTDRQDVADGQTDRQTLRDTNIKRLFYISLIISAPFTFLTVFVVHTLNNAVVKTEGLYLTCFGQTRIIYSHLTS